MRLRPVLPALLLAFAILPAPAAAQEDPGVPCLTNRASSAVGGEARVFCEPLESTFFLQWDQFVAGLAQLEEAHPDFVEVREIGTSVQGLPILFVEVTNERSQVPRDEKLQLGYSASIHANEAAGREGMARVVEDLAAGVGPYGAQLQPLLDHLIVNVWFPNPDSWASGDYFDADEVGGVHPPAGCAGSVPATSIPAPVCGFSRENANGFDLNRQFPNPGWILPEHAPMSQPEARAIVEELRYSGNHTNLAAGADLHGMLNSPNMVRSIIPNQDYDFRRMVLIVDQLRLTQERVEENPAYAEWQTADELAGNLDGVTIPDAVPCVPDPIGLVPCPDDVDDVHDKPFLWGARWDQIGYTDSGFTSDYLTLSPRSPTGGMGAVGTIVEFAYSHIIPDNRYVAKLTDMHVAGVREIVRAQMEMALRLDSPVLAGTGPVAYVDDGRVLTSEDDPNAFGLDLPSFDLDDAEARFAFKQVPYAVTNQRFWADLGRFSVDPVDPLAADRLDASALAGHESLAITDQAIDSLTDAQVADIRAWVEDGHTLLLTDGALRFLDRAGLTQDAVKQTCVYIGHSDLEDPSHALLAGVDWNARVTGEASATGFQARAPGLGFGGDANYPQWGVDRAAFEAAGGQVVGTTQGTDRGESPSCTFETGDRLATLGRLPVGAGRVDILGAALPMPTQAFDHRYGLADYSVSALTYWVVMNSLGGHVETQAIASPFVPSYSFDPLYGRPAAGAGQESPGPAALALVAAVLAAAVVLRRRA